MAIAMRVILPGNVRVRDVATVMGAYAGLNAVNMGNTDNPFARVSDACVAAILSQPGCAEIGLQGKTVDGCHGHFCTYFFEPSHCDGRMIVTRSTPFWIALMTKVVDFFGGSLDYQDCDGDDMDYHVPHKSRDENSPGDGEPYKDFQNRILAIVPLTKNDLELAVKYAAYAEL